jgi:hypothetical protein
MRLFKVCARADAASEIFHLTQCRSAQSSGAGGEVPFTSTYRIDRLATTSISIEASAGTAKSNDHGRHHISKT